MLFNIKKNVLYAEVFYTIFFIIYVVSLQRQGFLAVHLPTDGKLPGKTNIL